MDGMNDLKCLICGQKPDFNLIPPIEFNALLDFIEENPDSIVVYRCNKCLDKYKFVPEIGCLN